MVIIMVLQSFIVKAPVPVIDMKWKRISHKQSAKWQHLSLLKACAFFSLQKT